MKAIGVLLCPFSLSSQNLRWHFLAGSFTSYFRMMLVHLGVLGWQQAFSPVGLSPSTEQVRPAHNSTIYRSGREQGLCGIPNVVG